MTVHRRPLLIAVALFAAGCESPGDQPQKALAAPKPPPDYHAARPTPIDAGLQDRARGQLAAALASPDELVRAHALESIADLAPADAAALVLPRLTDPSLLVRKAAAITAGRLKLEAARGPLVELVTTDVQAGDPSDPDRAMYALQARMAAVFALHSLGDRRFSHDFERTAVDPRPQVRGDTALLLSLIGDASAEPILFRMMKRDRVPNVRLQAAAALWRLGDARGEDTLIQATVSSYASDRMIALLALAAPRDRQVLRNVFGLITDEYPEVGLVAARAAAQLGNDAGVGVADHAAADGDPMQKALAALALGDMHRADAQPVLARLLADESADVRLTAAAALLEIGRAPVVVARSN